jgi:hypothetical protein
MIFTNAGNVHMAVTRHSFKTGSFAPSSLGSYCKAVCASLGEGRGKLSHFPLPQFRFGTRIHLGRCRMRHRFTGRAVAFLASISLVAPAYAQTPAAAARPTVSIGPFSYDVSKETTLTGTVSSVLAKPSAGMIMGAHLLLETASGTVDASLGRFALWGDAALSVSAGQLIQVTGVMKTLQGQQVFLVRTVKVNDRVYTIRDEHGHALSPQTRARQRQVAGQNGERT